MAGNRTTWIRGGALALWCLVLAALLSANRILSLSVDSSYHLQVMEVVRHAFIVPLQGHEWMAEMAYYPKLSHRLAGLFATLGWKHLNALMMAGTLGAAVAWACLFEQARRVSLTYLILAFGLSAFNIAVTRGTFGGELVDNFFFPQIVGEGVALLALVGATALLRRPRPAYVVFAAAAVGFCGCFHLVPTLQLAGALMAMLGVTWLREMIRTRRFEPVGLVGLIVIPAAVVLNPFFSKMRFIAGNNGVLNLAAKITMGELAAVAALLTGLSAWLLLLWLLRPADEPDDGEGDSDSDRATLMIAALGAACGLAMLAQYMVYRLTGDGSPYAVMKHAFGVFGLLAFVAPLWGLMMLDGRVAPLEAALGAARRRPLGVVLAVVAQTAVMLCLFLRPSMMDVPRIDAMLEDVRQVRVTRGLHGDQVLFSADLPTPINAYMATIAMLQAPHGANVMSLMADGRPDRPGDSPYLVTLVGDAYDRPGCRSGSPIGLVAVIQGACLEPPSLRFKAGGSGVSFLRSGWSTPEGGGVWADGKRSVVAIPVTPEQRALKTPVLEVAGFAFLPPQSPRRTVIVSVPGGPSARFDYDLKTVVDHKFVLPLTPSLLAAPTLTVVFDTPDAVAPKTLGLGTDSRLMGAGLESMRIADAGSVR